ncbi:MAG: thermonuclease family protein [Nitrospinae bacterium]|nr:thermonuclease family protein [Nitrospinota bacterium]
MLARLAVVLCACLQAVASTSSYAGKIETAVIVHVIDGDTVVALIGKSRRKVRLLGIDAPEKEGPYTRWEPMSREARTRVEELALHKTVELSYGGQTREDKYGRLLGYVTLPGGTDLNETLIREGLAEAFHKFRHERRERYHRAEAEAKSACRGLWSMRPPCAGVVQ